MKIGGPSSVHINPVGYAYKSRDKEATASVTRANQFNKSQARQAKNQSPIQFLVDFRLLRSWGLTIFVGLHCHRTARTVSLTCHPAFTYFLALA
jgi:hypothetical protein